MPRKKKDLEADISNDDVAEETPKPENKPEQSFEDKAKTIKEILDAQPKKTIMIPKDPSDKSEMAFTVQINGYTYAIKRGVYVEVPEQIAQIVMDSLNQTEQAYANALKRVPDGERMEFDNSK